MTIAVTLLDISTSLANAQTKLMRMAESQNQLLSAPYTEAAAVADLYRIIESIESALHSAKSIQHNIKNFDRA